MRFSRFFLLAVALVGLTTFAYAKINPKPKAQIDSTAALRPSPAITTLKNGIQVVNTTSLASDVKGYKGTTPVEIQVQKGRIVKIELLPHGETPRFYVRAADHLNWSAFEGKTLREAANAQVDAISGATLSSNALLENVRRGIAHAIAQQQPAAKK